MAKSAMGPKEAAARALREAAGDRPRAKPAELKKVVAAIPAKTKGERIEARAREKIARQNKTERRKKLTAADAKRIGDSLTEADAPPKKPRAKKDKKPKVTPSGRPFVTSAAVAEYMARKPSKENPMGGASMEEMCEHFGIKEHPMRAKIFHARKNMGLNVELVSRYYNRGPAEEA